MYYLVSADHNSMVAHLMRWDWRWYPVEWQ